MKYLTAYNTIYAVAIAATAYAFGLSSGNFFLLVYFQLILLLLPILALIKQNDLIFNKRNICFWLLITILLALTTYVNSEKYIRKSLALADSANTDYESPSLCCPLWAALSLSCWNRQILEGLFLL